MKMIEIAILCTLPPDKTNYRHIPGLQIFDQSRDAYTFSGNIPVITHAPCAQWSRLHKFANDNPKEKELAYFCFEHVNKNGGIFEHPSGSHFFKHVGADMTKIISIDQVRFCHPGRKRTYLYFHLCKPLPLPIGRPVRTNDIANLSKLQRENTPIRFAKWLVNSLRYSYGYTQLHNRCKINIYNA